MIPKEGPTDRLGNFVLVDGRCTIIEYSDLPESLARQIETEARLVIKAKPEFADGYGILGSALATQGKNPEAAAAFEMAARLAPTHEVYSMNLAAVYFAQDKYQQAKPLLMELQNSRDHRFADAARSYLKSIARFEQGPVPR